MGRNAIIPKFLFEDEDIICLRDKGITFYEGFQPIGKVKVPCYKFLNITETEVFDELDKHSINEATSAEAALESKRNSYANRAMSILFLKIRMAMNIPNQTDRLAVSCALISAVNSLACLNIDYAKRFLPILRGM